MNQPFTGQLGNRLIELLESPDFHTLKIFVAFAKNSGVLRVKKSLEKFRVRGGKVDVYVGVDLGVTTFEALTALLLCSDTLNVVHSEKGQTFHAKIYQFLGNEKGLIIVGSNNLTAGGLWTNYESSAIIPISSSRTEDIEILRSQENYILKLTSLEDCVMHIRSQEDVDNLLQNGYIFKEVTQQVRIAQANAVDGVRARLFGNGTPNVLPRMDLSAEETAMRTSGNSTATVQSPRDTTSRTLWLETRKLTGGSRNILDLSMKCLVEFGDPAGTSFDLGEPGYMRGAVEFFGINPSSTDVHKDITLNFEGVDYFNNTVLFPTGENANGTWRLQIKGISTSGDKITDAFRAKGQDHFLVEKLVTFTKIEEGYFFISVFPESELESLKSASQILARNGSSQNAKQLGLL